MWQFPAAQNEQDDFVNNNFNHTYDTMPQIFSMFMFY